MQKEFDKAKKAKLVEEEKKKGYRYQTPLFLSFECACPTEDNA